MFNLPPSNPRPNLPITITLALSFLQPLPYPPSYPYPPSSDGGRQAGGSEARQTAVQIESTQRRTRNAAVEKNPHREKPDGSVRQNKPSSTRSKTPPQRYHIMSYLLITSPLTYTFS